MQESTKIKIGTVLVFCQILILCWISAVTFCEDKHYEQHNIDIQELVK